MLYTFTDCELDTQRRTFRRAGQLRHLRPKVFDILLYLLMHRDRVIAKQELCEQVWPEQFISDTTIESTLRAVRQAVGDSGKGQQLIQTFVRHGYRLVTDVAEHNEEIAAAPTPAGLESPLVEEQGVGHAEAETGLPSVSGVSLPADAGPEPSRQCAGCQAVQRQHGGVCDVCGTRHGRTCPDCGQAMEPYASVCVACRPDWGRPGASLEPSAAAPAQATSATATIRSAATMASGGVADAERRHLTVLSCSLGVALEAATPPDVDTLYEVMHAYHAACAAIVARFEGYIVQYLSTGLLVYFGFPLAHEDDAQRAVRAGLEIVTAVPQVVGRPMSLEVRVGIHTGMVIMDSVGAGAQQTPLALGEVPQAAARLLEQATPQTVVCSAATWRLVAGWFLGEALPEKALPDLARPGAAYRVLGESGAQSRLEIAGPERLTPLVGRAAELTLLQERWAQTRDGMGQVVLLSGEAGIGKSRLAETLRAQVGAAGCPQIVWRCSPYHTHSALFPVIEHLRRVLRLHSEDPPDTQLNKLEQMLAGYHRLVPAQVVPLFAVLLAVPLGQRYPSWSLTPEQYRQQTHAALVAWLLEEAERQPVLVLCEDLHWADPSTLDLLNLLLTQIQTVPILMLLVCRPGFRPPWPPPAHLTQFTLSRFTRPQAEQMFAALVGSALLPQEVREQVLARTDGVPLFLEELVKMLQESGQLQEPTEHHGRTGPSLPLVIPATLQDALMARLDRLGSARDLALLGATWGREFTYAQMQTLVPLEESTFQQRLGQLVEAEILYQRGLPPQASYRFKHALIQETAYQSLLRGTRQAYHRRIAQALEEHFPETVQTHPELLAQHYTAAGLSAAAMGYWQRAGQQALERSAYAEAIAHLTQGLHVLTTLAETPERARHELALQTALGPALMALQGYDSGAVAQVYARARELCEQLGETAQLFPVLWGLWRFYLVREEMPQARQTAAQFLELAQCLADPTSRVWGHWVVGMTLYFVGEVAAARTHLEAGHALYHVPQHHAQTALYDVDAGVACLSYGACALWVLGYPEQALQRSREALTLARQLSHPFSLVTALHYAAILHQYRREGEAVWSCLEESMRLCSEQGFTHWLARGRFMQGWAMVVYEQNHQGLEQMRKSPLIQGRRLGLPWYFALLSEAYGALGQAQEGLHWLAEAQAAAQNSGEHIFAAELQRQQGELLLLAAGPTPAAMTAAEDCFARALAVARHQEARLWELRAVLSLSRLRQQQGQGVAAYPLLAETYGWFREGFATTDLQEARALLTALRLPGA